MLASVSKSVSHVVSIMQPISVGSQTAAAAAAVCEPVRRERLGKALPSQECRLKIEDSV